MQRQIAVSAYMKSKQLLLLAITERSLFYHFVDVQGTYA